MSEILHPDDSEVAFCLTADTGRYERRALLLVRSIRHHHPGASILTFIPENSIEDMDQATVTELDRKTTVETGAMPLPSYPVSAFAEAWRRGCDRFAANYIVAIDTDAVLLNPLTVPQTEADLFATPAHIGARAYCAADAPKDDWKQVLSTYDISPSRRTLVALADRYPTWPPTYNAGVVITKRGDIPETLIRRTKDIYRREAFTETNYFSETVALATLAADPSVSFAPLSLRHNYMMGGYPSVPDEVEILHYQFLDTFATLRNTRHLELLSQWGASLDPRLTDYAIRLLSLGVFRAGRVMGYKRAEQFADRVQPIFDWNNPEP